MDNDTYDAAGPLEGGLPRRTLLRGAAWSVPLVAVAVATPAYAASPPATLSIVGTCSGNYVLSRINPPNGNATNHIVPQLPAGSAPAVRRFTITALTAAIPTSIVFTLSHAASPAFVAGSIVFSRPVTNVNTVGTTTTFRFNAAIPQGQTATVDLLPALFIATQSQLQGGTASLGAASTTILSQGVVTASIVTGSRTPALTHTPNGTDYYVDLQACG